MNSEAQMAYIVYAIPVFFTLIFIEWIATSLRNKHYYRINDSINSLSAGLLSVVFGVVSKTLTVGIYVVAFTYLSIAELSSSSMWVWVWVWVAGFIIYDFCYYWNHRLGHEINILWAAHSVHHQSEEYNLTTALRQTSTGFIFGWVFYLPMAVIGIPPVVFLTVGAMNLLYQFWVHTRHIPKLGIVEWIFITPSNHRVHHAQNQRYIDKNYGGVFIVWDRLFGTFTEESDEEKIIYGVRKPLASWNPLWANIQHYSQLFNDARRTEKWGDKLGIWWRRTGWRPEDVSAQYPIAKADLTTFQRFDIKIPSALVVYTLFQFSLMVLFTTWIMAISHLHPLWCITLLAALLGYSLYSIGFMLEGRPGFSQKEMWRLALSAVTAVTLVAYEELTLSTGNWLVLLGYLTFSALLLIRLDKGLALQEDPATDTS